MAKIIRCKKEFYLKKAFSLVEARVYLCLLPDLTEHYLTRAQGTQTLLAKASRHCLSSTSLEVTSREP